MVEPIQVTAIAIACLAGYSYRADFTRYSLFTVGVFRRVDRTVVKDPDYSCDEFYCEQQTEIAEQRRYFKEIVIAGMPTLRYDGGYSHYCEDHVSFEVRDDLDSPKRSKTERLTVSIATAIVAISEGKSKLEVVESDAFDSKHDVTTATGDALTLIPTMILVVIAAALISLFHSVD